MKPQILLLAFTLLLGSCASSYKAINPAGLTYLSKSTDKSVTLEYQYGILPGKYAKNEVENDFKLIAIKITNNSGHDVVLDKDIRLYFGDTTKVLLTDKKLIYNRLKQQSNFYLLYLALTTVALNLDKGDGTNYFVPIGYVVGPGLAVGNFLVATTVNHRFKNGLNKYYIPPGTIIKNNATLYGLIGIKTWKYEALTLKVD